MITVIGLIGGLALFVFGLYETSAGLRAATAGKLRVILNRLSAKRAAAVVTGVVLAVALQSSTAVTVLVVGLAASGALALEQSLAVVLGAAVGTTVTVQLLSFNPEGYALLGVAAGLVVLFTARYTPMKAAARALIGLSLVFFSMTLMKQAVKPLQESPGAAEWIARMADNRVLGFAAGIVLTGVTHSSAATVGLAMALARAKLLGLEGAIPIVLGANVGTTITGFFVSIGTNRAGLRTAIGYLLVKSTGALVFLVAQQPFQHLVRLTADDPARAIANAHTLFAAILAVGWFLPLGLAGRGLRLLVREAPPAAAQRLSIAGARDALLRIGEACRSLLESAGAALNGSDLAAIERVERMDDLVDRATVELSRAVLVSEFQPAEREKILALAARLERIGDLASGELMANARTLVETGMNFSVLGQSSLQSVHEAALEVLAAALASLRCERKDIDAATAALREASRKAYALHIDQLRAGIWEARDTDKVFSEVLIVYGEIGRYCLEIGKTEW